MNQQLPVRLHSQRALSAWFFQLIDRISGTVIHYDTHILCTLQTTFRCLDLQYANPNGTLAFATI